MENDILEHVIFSGPDPVILFRQPDGSIAEKGGSNSVGISLEKKVMKNLHKYNYMTISRPVYAVRCIQKGKDIPAVLDDFAQIVGPSAKICDYDEHTLERALKRESAVLIPDGFVITAGRTEYEAKVCLAVLEKAAEIYLKSAAIGSVKPVSPWKAALEHLVYEKKYSQAEEKLKMEGDGSSDTFEEFDKIAEGHDDEAADTAVNSSPVTHEDAPDNAIFMSDHEEKLREAIIEYGKKLLEVGLVQGTWGNISVRLGDSYMLCTPSGRDYNTLRPEEIVKVNIDTLEYEGSIKPTSEKGLHAMIYQNYPAAGAIVHTHSKYCCMYAACDLGMRAESRGDTVFRCAEYAFSGTNKLARNVCAVLDDSYGAFMSHHGMICYGASLADAYDKAEQMEFTAHDKIEKAWKERIHRNQD